MKNLSLSGAVKVGLKAAVTIVLVWWLLSRLDQDVLWTHVGSVSISLLIPLLALFVMLTLLQALRWRIVLKRQGWGLPLRLTVSLTMLGQFFEQLLPSTIGSDIVRVWGVRRDGASLSIAANAAIVDRMVALLALMLMGMTGLPFLFDVDSGGTASWSVLSVSIAGAIGFIGITFVWASPLSKIRWLPIRGIVVLSSGIWNLVTDKKALSVTVALSLVTHAGIILTAFFIGNSMGLAAGLAGYLAVMPSVILISSLPISVAGWGVRESATAVGLGLLGVPVEKAVAISIILGGIMAATGLCGGAYWLVEKFLMRNLGRATGPMV
jgi:glycosyltransferase 2 family protein